MIMILYLILIDQHAAMDMIMKRMYRFEIHDDRIDIGILNEESQEESS